MRTIAIINQKGGCGKTTTAINLAAALARRGSPTLLVDLDPQGHCAAGLAIPEDRIDLTIADVMLAGNDEAIDASRVVWRIAKGFDLAPCTMRLAGLEAARGGLAALPDKDSRLALAIDRLAGGPGERRYDCCVVDCPPSIGLLTYNALHAASEALIPVETSYFAYRGAGRQVNTIRALVKRLGSDRPHHLLATMHDPDSAVARATLTHLRARFGDLLLPVIIRLDQRLREAASLGQPALELAPESKGATDYAALATWLVDNPPAASRSEERHGAEALGGEGPAADPTVREPRTDAADERATPASLVTRAAEMAARVRALALKGEALRARFGADEGAAPAGPAHARGPVPTPAGVRFVVAAHPEAAVFLAGEFNGWSASATPMAYEPSRGLFSAVIPLEPGRHAYRFIIDGEWFTDPLNPEHRENGFGEWDSVATVRPATPAGAERPVVVVAPRNPVLHG